MCVGEIDWVIWCPLAAQFWEHATEELMTGAAGQSCCLPQLKVNMPAREIRVQEEVHYNMAFLLFNLCSHRAQKIQVIKPSGGGQLF